MGNKEITRQIELLCDDLNAEVDEKLQRDEEKEIDNLTKELWSY